MTASVGKRWALIALVAPILSCAGQEGSSCSAPAKALFQQQQFKTAQTDLEGCVAKDSNDNASWELLGLTLASEGDTEQAGRDLIRALSAVPENRQFRINLAVFLASNDRIDAADQVVEPLLGSSTDANLDRLVGYLRLEQHQEREAITWFERALERDPDSLEALYRLGYAYHAAGDLEKAMALYRRVLELDPDQFPAQLQLGKVLLLRGDSGEAERQLTHAARIRPDYASAWRYLSEAEMLQNHLQAALASARTAVDRGSQDPRNHYQLGTVLTHLGDPQAARAELDVMQKLRASQRGAPSDSAPD
jgi:Flp pilus assembly protein TadD